VSEHQAVESRRWDHDTPWFSSAVGGAEVRCEQDEPSRRAACAGLSLTRRTLAVREA